MVLYPDEHETIEGVGRALRAGRTTCVEVLEGCLGRIDEWEPRVEAWVKVDREGAFEQARVLDGELSAGRCRGPLHGIPIGVKDIIDVKGLPTAAGFGPWRDRVADSDAALVGTLRRGGAVILGKTVTTQFAWVDPPPTRNPWDAGRTPGGSSSGSAAAVATGMCLGAIGTQTGGSIIRPASFCGVCGLKPALFEVPGDGVFPFAPSFDHPGPIARTTRDLRLLFEAIRNLDRERGSWRWCDRPIDPATTVEQVEADLGRLLSVRANPPTLYRLRGFYDRRSEPVMREAFEQALAALGSAGSAIRDEPDELFAFEEILRDHRVIMAVEAESGHRERLSAEGARYAPRIASLLEEGRSIPAQRHALACDDQISRIADVVVMSPPFEPGEALILPATIGPAPDPSTTGDPAFNSPWSYLGWPAVSFPIGLSSEGLPLAVQLVGKDEPGATNDLLEVASWCEAVIRRAYRPSARSD